MITVAVNAPPYSYVVIHQIQISFISILKPLITSVVTITIIILLKIITSDERTTYFRKLVQRLTLLLKKSLIFTYFNSS